MWGTTPAIRVDGRVLQVAAPDRTAAELAPLLLWDDLIVDNPLPYLFASLPRAQDRIWVAGRILDRRRPLTVAVLHRITDALVHDHTRWRRWEAKFLWTSAYGMWHEVDGDLQARGVNIADMPLGQATNAIFGTLRGWYQQRESKDYEQFQRDLKRKPPRVVRAEIEDATDDDFAEDAEAAAVLTRRARDRDTAGDSVVEYR